MNASERVTTARQILAVQALELRKRFLGKRAIPVYMLAMIPLVLFGGRFIAARILEWNVEESLAHDRVIYAVLFRTLVLRFVVYFGCVAVFVPLFRGDILDRSLHYYFLAPMKRQTLTAAKYLSGLLAALVLFNGVTLANVDPHVPDRGTGGASEQFQSGRGWLELGAYLLVTSLACVGYGAVFLAAGVFVKNPIVPAVVILGWESINALLPPCSRRSASSTTWSRSARFRYRRIRGSRSSPIRPRRGSPSRGSSCSPACSSPSRRGGSAVSRSSTGSSSNRPATIPGWRWRTWTSDGRPSSCCGFPRSSARSSSSNRPSPWRSSGRFRTGTST